MVTLYLGLIQIKISSTTQPIPEVFSPIQVGPVHVKGAVRGLGLLPIQVVEVEVPHFRHPGTWLPDVYSQLFRMYVFGPLGF